MKTEELKLDDIKLNGGTQPREAINDETVTEYTEALRDGVTFPPVIVVHDGASHWLVDGFHRFHAANRAGLTSITAEVKRGTLRDAILMSLAANVDHGLRRTNADKRKAVMTMLTNELVSADDDGNPWSNRAIARCCRVDHKTVSRWRQESSLGNSPVRNPIDSAESDDRSGIVTTDAAETAAGHDDSLSSADSETADKSRAYITKHGTKSVMKTGNIGRGAKKYNIGANRSARERELDRKAMKPVRGHSGLSPRTALDVPHDPQLAAKGLLHALGELFVRDLIPELQNCLEGTHQ